VAVLCAADFLVVMDGLIVAVALPSIQDTFGFATGELQWVVSAYVLCFGGFLLLGGRLGDLYGRRRILLLGLVIFAAGALLAGLAWNGPVLVVGRAVQGLGAALMAPTALALLTATFNEGPQRTRALGWWSAAGSLGIPVGALLGGVLTAALGWRWVLLINVPAAVLAAAGTWRAVPESYDRTRPRRLDAPGAVLITAGLALLIFAIVQAEYFTSPDFAWRILPPLFAGVLLLSVFVAVERRAPAPLIPLRILRVPGLLAANLVGAALPVGLGALLFLATLYLQRILGFAPLHTGLAYLALAAPVVAASPVASWLVTRVGGRTVAGAGFLLQAVGLVLLARAPSSGAFLTDVLPAFVLVGSGAPLAFVPTTAAAMSALQHETGLASGVFNTFQQIGNALVLAVLATLAATWTGVLLDHGAAQDPALTGGYQAGFLLAAAITAASAAAAYKLPETDQEHGGSGNMVTDQE
jgi:EmrB/QacA subfamily drug resistance transporter